MSVARARFAQLVLSRLGGVSLWTAQGPSAFDCSGLVMWALDGVGVNVPDHTAQMLSDETPEVAAELGAKPLPGDLCFYGADAAHVTHVAVWLVGGRVVSADGATSKVTRLQVAAANPAARVRLHESPTYRRDYLATHRNRFLDDLDKPKEPKK